MARTSKCTPAFFLQHPDDFGEIRRGRIAARAEHPHQALRRYPGRFGQRQKADGRVDEIAQHRASGADVALDQSLHSFLKQCRAESRIGFGPGLNVIPKAAGQGHGYVPQALFGRLDQLDVLFQQFVDEVVEGNSSCLGARGQKGENVGVEMHWRDQDGVLPVEPPTLGFREIVFVLHVIGHGHRLRIGVLAILPRLGSCRRPR